jgi:starch phosphorylase
LRPTSPTPIGSAASLRNELAELARDLAWTWHPEARELFRSLDPGLFERLEHNPAALADDLDEDALARAGADPAFVERLDAVRAALGRERTGARWWDERHENGFLVAYFSCEFGVDESLPIYAGGLGVLAGDHLKSSSDLGMPLVAVGLLYQRGYFRQELDEGGWQIERYPVNDPARLPLTLERTTDGSPVIVEVELAGERVQARVWRAQVGRVALYLLDTDLEENSEAAREICGTLYGGDREQRIRQELLLGVGGCRALAVLGFEPSVWHLNEGHSAFLQLERLRRLVEAGQETGEALEHVRSTTLFTTHTPVPAGNEVFDPELVRRYVGPLVDACGLAFDDLLALGRIGEEAGFGLTPFALRMSAAANAVSELHGEVAREMWHELDRTIGHVTNGVHRRSWQHAPDGDLLDAHRERKRELLELTRRRFASQGGDPESLRLDPDALTIGFARRFATYKRAGLLFSDPDRLGALLGDPERPVQVLLAGKAHPADDGGKRLIQDIVRFSRDPRSAGRVVFLSDYEMTLARRLVQGVDVWLNTPIRPLEASGTSGMKAAMNGVLNCSILDGWWAEGYAPEVGFAIGGPEKSTDEADAAELFRVLEQEVVPAFYGGDRWAAMMAASIAQLGERFGTDRMVREYAERYYLPLHRAAATKT